MSADPRESLPTNMSPNKATALVHGSFSQERRKRSRSTVHWPIWFFRHQSSQATETISTQNLSSDGFYCLSRTAFVPGETLTCRLEVPSHEPFGAAEPTRLLECRAKVIRTETAGTDGLFGVAFRIEDYRFVSATPEPELVEPPGPVPVNRSGKNSSG
jgi:hypothetical protein